MADSLMKKCGWIVCLILCLMPVVSGCAAPTQRGDREAGLPKEGDTPVATATEILPAETPTATETQVPLITPTLTFSESLINVPNDGVHWRQITLPGERGPSVVYSIDFASKTVAWAGTNNGLWKIEGDQTTQYESDDIISSSALHHVKIAPDGKIWWTYSPLSNTLSSWDGKSKRRADYPLSCQVNDFTFSKDGTLWVACGVKPGIETYKNGVWHHMQVEGDVLAIVIMDDNSIWFNDNGGIDHLKDGKLTKYPPKQWFVSYLEYIGEFDFLISGPDDTLWGMSSSTVFHFTGTNWENYEWSSPSNGELGAVAISPDGTVWAGDMFKRNGRNYRLGDLPFHLIYDVKVAPDGSVWYGTEHGIYIYDNKE
jgi:ligand-binding sensor domain-containing protein